MPRSQGTSRKGKPKKADRAAGMGRALQRAQTQKYKCKSNGSSRGGGMAASGAKSIGMDVDPSTAASNKIKSVLETDDLTDFLQRAELADKEFATEHERFVVVDNVAQEVSSSRGSNQYRSINHEGKELEDEDEGTSLARDKATKFDFQELSVPRRPKWDKNTTAEELDRNEREAFLNWRRNIAKYEEEISSSRISVTPFEKNIEVWRQLWRVIERSHCIVLVVDGRNPQFYLSMDLRKYVEDELGKSMIVVVNKCDYLTQKQRQMWHEYFKSLDGLEHIFFSAVKEQEILDALAVAGESNFNGNQSPSENNDYMADKNYPTRLNPKTIGLEEPLARTELLGILCAYAEMEGVADLSNIEEKHDSNSNDHTTESVNTVSKSKVEFGMVGFPNVGKSSVLNVLVGASKNNHKANRVGVASMPGKTKHFQTLNVPDYANITLVDCPGLVFPSFVSSSADMVLAGVYPLPQVRDFWPAVELICKRFPRDILEGHFGITLPRPSALDIAQQGGSVVLKPPTAEELLGTYCITRSLLAPSSGVPDYYRASRVVLRDYVTGSLLYCHSPPHISPVGADLISLNAIPEDAKTWEATFHRETLASTFRRHEKLREKLGVVETKDGQFLRQNKVDGIDKGIPSSSNALEIEDGIDILEMIDVVEKPKSGNRGKSHKKIQKHGKKGRKQRNKDPYGCHSEPELDTTSNSAGLIVSAGKYSKGYTRINYRGAKSAS